MHQNTFGKASTSGVASVPGILPVQLCLVQSLGRLYVPLPRTFLGFFLCNYTWSRALAGFMLHFRSQVGNVPWSIPVQPCLIQSLGRFYVSLPSTCLSAVSTWGTFLLRPVLVPLPVHLILIVCIVQYSKMLQYPVTNISKFCHFRGCPVSSVNCPSDNQ